MWQRVAPGKEDRGGMDWNIWRMAVSTETPYGKLMDTLDTGYLNSISVLYDFWQGKWG